MNKKIENWSKTEELFGKGILSLSLYRELMDTLMSQAKLLEMYDEESRLKRSHKPTAVHRQKMDREIAAQKSEFRAKGEFFLEFGRAVEAGELDKFQVFRTEESTVSDPGSAPTVAKNVHCVLTL